MDPGDNSKIVKGVVRARLGDKAGVTWSDAEIYEYLNEALRELAKQLPDAALWALAKIASQALTAGQSAYSVPSDFLRLRRLEYKGIEATLWPVAEREALRDIHIVGASESNPFYYLSEGNVNLDVGKLGAWQVSDAGSAAYNGKYIEDGTHLEYPAYEIEAGGKWLWREPGVPAGFCWRLSETKGEAPIAYSGLKDTVLPANDWTVESGDSPAPTVALAYSGTSRVSQSNGESYEIWYIRQPTAISKSVDPDLGEPFYNLMEDWALYRCLEQANELEQAAFRKGWFQAQVDLIKARYSGKPSFDDVPTDPALIAMGG